MTEARWYVVNAAGNMHSCGSEDIARQKAKVFDARNSEYGPHRVVRLVDAAELEKAQDRAGQLEMALESLVERCNQDAGWCNEDSVIYAEALLERIYKERTA